jgi:hypothetical protein
MKVAEVDGREGTGVSDAATLYGRLRQAGSLSAQQLDYLRQRGFLPALTDRAGPRAEGGWDDEGPIAEDETERLGGTARGRGGRRPREAEAKVDALVGLLEPLYRSRRKALAALVPLAEAEEKSPDAAVRWLRQRSPEEVAGPLGERIAAGVIGVDRLWAVLALDDFDEVGVGTGQVSTSYRALVRAARAGQTDLPMSYAWLLRAPAVSAVYDLLVTQRLLLEAAGLLHRRDAAVLRDGLRRRPHPLAFWVLLILFNVDLEAKRLGKSGALRRVTARPTDAVWARAWSQALLMKAEVLPLLAELHERPSTDQGDAPLFCPASWERLAFRYCG